MNTIDTAAKRTKYRIEAMDCPTEEALIRGKLGSIPGIIKLDFNLVQRVLTVDHNLDSVDPIGHAINTLGFEAILHDGSPQGPAITAIKTSWVRWLPLILAGLAALASEVFEWAGVLAPWLPAGFALVAIALSGITTYKKGWIAIINRNLNINALMSIAVTGAMIMRQWPEAAMVMVLFSLAEKIEALSLDRARNAIKGLLALSPDMATIRHSDGTWKQVAANDVAVGAIARVRPGERISHDGIIESGNTAIDQSAITGESLPVEKKPGDCVFAGTVNQQGEIIFRVTAVANASTISRIIQLVEEAQSNRSPTQRFVDSFAKVYTPIVMLLALLVAIIPPLLLGGAWTEWVYKALVLLIIACPCALVVSTPVTIVSGLAKAARLGIIIKGGAYLEQAAKLQWVAFDKTGTITTGVPVQTDQIVLDESQDFWPIAASLAHRSDHPVSQAIARAYQTNSKVFHDVSAFRALPGRGVQGEVNGVAYHLGNHRLIEELKICNPDLEARLEALESDGKSTVILASSTKPVMVFAVADTIKETSQQALATLHGLDVKSLMLSGDNSRTAKAIGKQAGIDQIRGDQLPEDKAQAIKQLRSEKQIVGMVGDGINDAPALAHADIGIAMGGMGSDTAIETADVVLMDDDLKKVPALIELSRRTRRILGQNIIIALGLKLVFLIITLLGFGTMWMAVFADMGASLIVVFNGLRLMGNKEKK